MQKSSRFSRGFINNLIWFLASLLIAFFVWVIAISESDPIREQRFPQIPIQTQPPSGLLVVDQGRDTATVTVRAQQSTLDRLTSEDITVQAHLQGLGPGQHTVELDVDVTRRAWTDAQPKQIRVTLEEVQSRQVEIRGQITEEPPPAYEVGEIIFSESQAQVTGAASKVQQVVEAQALLDLSEQRTTLEQEVRLVPVNADGEEVTSVTIEPQTVRATVPINLPNNVTEVAVRPNIQPDTLPEGYVLLSYVGTPQTVFVAGPSSQVPDTLETVPIDLSNRTDDFEVTVPVVLPGGDLTLIGEQAITVSVSIAPQTSSTTFENISVSLTGLSEDFAAQIVPEQVSVLVTGPFPVVNSLQAADIEVILDLGELSPGTYELQPQVVGDDGELQADSVSVLPPEITVTITQQVEATEPPQSE